MKTGVSVFLAAFVALGASWFGFVFGSVKQLGGAKQTVVLQSGDTWPQQRTGEATLGLQVYRKYGCAACHTEQIRQTGSASEFVVNSLGAHTADEFKAYLPTLLVVPDLMDASNTIVGNLAQWNGQLPVTLYYGQDSGVPAALADKLKPLKDLKAEPRIVAFGDDLSHPGWGTRQSVAADFLYDEPVQLGGLRAGPDLANIGARAPNADWLLKHLYNPKSVVPNSTMPAFRTLFMAQKAGSGEEPVPTDEARQLVAYLLSLKANVPLYEAPYTPPAAPVAPVATAK